MWRISKKFKFEASHSLPGLPEGHQCGRLHGHSYTVEIAITGLNLVGPGWLLDFGEFQSIKELIDGEFDHRHLNDVVDFSPTSELLARYFFEKAVELLPLDPSMRVLYARVSETLATFAEYMG